MRRLRAGEEVTLVEHLDELRSRLFVVLAALAVGFGLAFYEHKRVLSLLNDQLPSLPCKKYAASAGYRCAHGVLQIIPTVTGITEPFSLAIMVSIFTGLLLASPIVFYQLYAFIIPAFAEGSSKKLWPILLMVPALFIGGVVFAYVLVLPAATNFLLGFDAGSYQLLPRASTYYTFACYLMAAMGLIFELPAFVLVLTKVGLLSSKLMRQKRRYAVVIMSIVAAALPGVDPVSMLAELTPLLVLYEVSIWLARLVEVKAEPEEEPEGAVT